MVGNTGFGVRVPGYRIVDFVISPTVLEMESGVLHMLGKYFVPKSTLSPTVPVLTLSSYSGSSTFLESQFPYL